MKRMQKFVVVGRGGMKGGSLLVAVVFAAALLATANGQDGKHAMRSRETWNGMEGSYSIISHKQRRGMYA